MTATVLPDTLCHLNGQTLPLCDAKISVLDRGFIFGDGIYEVIPVYGRRCFRFDEHMARLARSLDLGRPWRAGDGDVPRRLADRGGCQQCVGGA
jgi:hypothetical protein